MASNSPVVMPLSRCCLEKIQRRTPPDSEGELIWCRKCGQFLVFHHNAWKDADVLNNQEWHEFCYNPD
jgi:hypothetical protein